MEILFCGYHDGTGQPPKYKWYLIDANLLKKKIIDASPFSFSFSFSFNKKKLNPFFLPDSMLYEDTIPNYPFQRTAYLVIYRISSSYLLGWMEVFDLVL